MTSLARVALVLCLGGVLLAEDEPKPRAESPEIVASRKHVTRIEVQQVENESPIERVEKPLLLYGDAARANDRGSLWAWGHEGRPVFLLELFRPSGNDKLWVYGMTRTGATEIQVRLPGSGDWTWVPKTADVEFKSLAGADPPATAAAARLRQIKDLARRFSAHEFWDPNNSRYELRLMPQPVHRYSDESQGIADAAVFVFAHGTNPEATLFIEATGGYSPGWQYGVGRSCQAEFHMLLDEEDVHTGPRLTDFVGNTNSVWLGSTVDQ